MTDELKDTNDPPRNPDFELAMAFFGSVVVGNVCCYVGCLLAGLSVRESINGIMLGTVAGIPWGFLTVIVAACAEPENRRSATMKMFKVLGVGLIILIYAVIWYAQF